MTGKDNVRKKFTQLFFLAPQDKGYYVLNDVLRFVETNEISQTNSVSAASPIPSAEVVGNAFVEQYYYILHHSPQLVHKFYQDSSSLRRPDANGVMTTVTNMQAINDKILSLKYEDYKAEIKTADAQDSYGKGVIVLVTGCMTGKDNVRKKFTQSFFLAPQYNGYYVLNDVFRFVEEKEISQTNSVSANGISESAEEVALTTEPGHCVNSVHWPGEVHMFFTDEGHSIYVRNLPYDATVEQLGEEFKKFGPIKPGGIQLRSSKQGFCFGFVEFESLSSMQNAIEASPVTIGERQAVIEEKRTTTRASHFMVKISFISVISNKKNYFEGQKYYNRNFVILIAKFQEEITPYTLFSLTNYICTFF
ncbi:hypothetical protein UlMin_008418 [Ulmus minor]